MTARSHEIGMVVEKMASEVIWDQRRLGRNLVKRKHLTQILLRGKSMGSTTPPPPFICITITFIPFLFPSSINTFNMHLSVLPTYLPTSVLPSPPPLPLILSSRPIPSSLLFPRHLSRSQWPPNPTQQDVSIGASMLSCTALTLHLLASTRRTSSQPKSSRQQFSACGACRMRR